MKRAGKIFRITLFSLGSCFLLMLIISFTRIPYDMQMWLAKHQSSYKFYPDEIILLGGSGMPSESNLVRIYYVSALAQKYPQSKVLVVHPHDDLVLTSMCEELELRGVDSTRIETENQGTQTHDQAAAVLKNYPRLMKRHVLLVTSPENMLRSVLAFRKAGFESVGGHAAIENAMFTDLSYDFKKSGGKVFVPDVSKNLALRYNFWNYLKIEISCFR